MKKILCFGDSNTWGFRPDGNGRYDENTRWTGRVQRMLGDKYEIIEEGLCGRTTVFEDERAGGRKGLDVVEKIAEAHNPVDLLVVMLGTNDCKTKYGASAKEIAAGLEQVVFKAKNKTKKDVKVLVVSPILLGKGVGEEGYDIEFNEHSEQVSYQLAGEYKIVAEKNGFYFLDASRYANPSFVDREHLDEQGHKKLADAIYQKLKEMLLFTQ